MAEGEEGRPVNPFALLQAAQVAVIERDAQPAPEPEPEPEPTPTTVYVPPPRTTERDPREVSAPPPPPSVFEPEEDLASFLATAPSTPIPTVSVSVDPADIGGDPFEATVMDLPVSLSPEALATVEADPFTPTPTEQERNILSRWGTIPGTGTAIYIPVGSTLEEQLALLEPEPSLPESPDVGVSTEEWLGNIFQESVEAKVAALVEEAPENLESVVKAVVLVEAERLGLSVDERDAEVFARQTASLIPTLVATVELSTGERVSVESYDALSVEDQYLLNQIGIDDFNKRTIIPEGVSEEEYLERTFRPVERAPLSAVTLTAPIVDPSGLSPEEYLEQTFPVAPELVIDPIDMPTVLEQTFVPVESTPTQVDLPFESEEGLETFLATAPDRPITEVSPSRTVDFATATALGIPLDTLLPEPVEEESELQFGVPTEPEPEPEPPSELEPIAVSAPVPLPQQPFSSLSSEQRVALGVTEEQWNSMSSGDRFALWDDSGLTTFWPEVEGGMIPASAFLSLIPIWGTVQDWDEMSPTWRGISIAADATFILAPLLARSLVASRLGMVTKSAEMNRALKAVETSIDTSLDALRASENIGPASMDAIKASSKALAKAKFNFITATGRHEANTTRLANYRAKIADMGSLDFETRMTLRRLERELGESLQDVVATERRLEGTAETHIGTLKGLDQPLPESIANMADNVITQTRRAINTQLDASSAIKSQLGRAETSLSSIRGASVDVAPAKIHRLVGEIKQLDNLAGTFKEGLKERLTRLLDLRNAQLERGADLRTTHRLNLEIGTVKTQLATSDVGQIKLIDDAVRVVDDAVRRYPKDRATWTRSMLQTEEELAWLRSTSRYRVDDLLPLWEQPRPAVGVPEGPVAVKPPPTKLDIIVGAPPAAKVRPRTFVPAIAVYLPEDPGTRLAPTPEITPVPTPPPFEEPGIYPRPGDFPRPAPSPAPEPAPAPIIEPEIAPPPGEPEPEPEPVVTPEITPPPTEEPVPPPLEEPPLPIIEPPPGEPGPETRVPPLTFPWPPGFPSPYDPKPKPEPEVPGVPKPTPETPVVVVPIEDPTVIVVPDPEPEPEPELKPVPPPTPPPPPPERPVRTPEIPVRGEVKKVEIDVSEETLATLHLMRRVQFNRVKWSLVENEDIVESWGPFDTISLIQGAGKLSRKNRGILKQAVSSMGDKRTEGLDLLSALVVMGKYKTVRAADEVLPWRVES